MKVYNLAREFSASSESVIEALSTRGFEVKNHMSMVSSAMVMAVIEEFVKQELIMTEEQRKAVDQLSLIWTRIDKEYTLAKTKPNGKSARKKRYSFTTSANPDVVKYRNLAQDLGVDPEDLHRNLE